MPSTHDEILATWLQEGGDLDVVLARHNLCPAELRAFVADPAVIATMDAHESLLARRQRLLASIHQQNAAEILSKAMFDSPTMVECRRAAAALARLARDMTRRPTPASNANPTPSPTPPSNPSPDHQLPTNPVPPLTGSPGDRCINEQPDHQSPRQPPPHADSSLPPHSDPSSPTPPPSPAVPPPLPPAEQTAASTPRPP